MTRLPQPSPGTTSVPFEEGAVLFEPAGGEIHVLNHTGAIVWAGCCDGTDQDDLVDELVEAASQPRPRVADDVDRCIASLVAAGLVGGTRAGDAGVDQWRRHAPDEADGGDHRIRVTVLGEVVEVRTASGWLHDRAQLLLADVTTDAPPTRWMVVEELPGGQVRIHGPRVGWRSHPDLAALLDALVAELNVVVTSWSGGLALHAGVVRHPGGAVLALPGASGAGKSTLVAALVRAGWDYVSDEALGLTDELDVVGYPKPLSLDATSRALLGLGEGGPADVPAADLRRDVRTVGAAEGGRLSLVVLPELRAASGAELRPVPAEEALTTLAPQAMNLRAAGLAGLRALVRASSDVPCWHLAHGDLEAAVVALDQLATT